MRKLLVLILTLAFALSLAGCGNPVATVNGQQISMKEYQQFLDDVLAIYEAQGIEITAEELPQLQSYVMEEMIYREVLRQAADELGVMPTKKEKRAYFEEQLALSYGDAKTGLNTISQLGLSEDYFLNGATVSLLQERISENLVPESTLSDEEAQALYEADINAWNTREVSHILIGPVSATEAAEGEELETDENGQPVFTDQEWAAAKARAEEIIKELDDGGDFAKLAEKESGDENTAVNGGALGAPFTREGSGYVEEFVAAAFALEKVGDYTAAPVKTVFGYHIILLTAKQDSGDMAAMLQIIKDTKLEEERTNAFNTFITEKQSAAVIERLNEETPADDGATEEDEAGDGAANEDPAAADGAADEGTP